MLALARLHPYNPLTGIILSRIIVFGGQKIAGPFPWTESFHGAKPGAGLCWIGQDVRFFSFPKELKEPLE